MLCSVAVRSTRQCVIPFEGSDGAGGFENGRDQPIDAGQFRTHQGVLADVVAEIGAGRTELGRGRFRRDGGLV